MLWNSECPVGISKEKYVRISMKEIGAILVIPRKPIIVELHSVFEFSRPEVAPRVAISSSLLFYSCFY